MKTKIIISFTILCMWMSSALHAQWINSITFQPSNPTVTDTITVLAACSFPSAGCSDHTKFISVVGTDIYASAIHCLGLMTVICYFTDTFKIDPLPAGNYTFHFQVESGFGPSPCTPGIVPGPMDSIPITVSPATGVEEYLGQDAVYVYPNPVKDQFQIKGLNNSDFPITLKLYSTSGKRVENLIITNAEHYFDVSKLPDAMYQLQIVTVTNKKIVSQFIKGR